MSFIGRIEPASPEKVTSLQADASNPNVRRVLDIIASTERTDKAGTGGGYNVGFNHVVIPSLADHPRKYYEFKDKNGKLDQSSAAGRYQFIVKTWDGVAKDLGLKDFSPANQDIAAVELIRRAGALEQIKNGDLKGGIDRLGGVWASFPSSPYPQPKVSQSTVDNLIAKGSIVNPKTNFAVAQLDTKPAPAGGVVAQNTRDILEHPFIKSLLQHDTSGSGQADTPLASNDFATVATNSTPPVDPYAPPVSFESPLFGPSPRDGLVAAANQIWDSIPDKHKEYT